MGRDSDENDKRMVKWCKRNGKDWKGMRREWGVNRKIWEEIGKIMEEEWDENGKTVDKQWVGNGNKW